jgi:hypothetical protein
MDINTLIKDLSPAALLVLVVYAGIKLIQDIVKNNAANDAADTKNELELISLNRSMLTMFSDLKVSIDLLVTTLQGMNITLPETIKANSAQLAAGLGERILALNTQIEANTLELLTLQKTIFQQPTTITDSIATRLTEILLSVHERIEQAQTQVISERT